MLTHAPVLETRPLDAPFGLEIVGADLTRDLDDATRKAIRDAWIDAGILLFRDIRNDDQAQMRLSSIFGEMEPAATADLNDPVNAFMMTLGYDPEDPTGKPNPFYRVDGIDRAGWLGWHWDQSFMPTIVRGAVLRMTEPARTMGETGFIDAIQAYDRLSDALKAQIDRLDIAYQLCINPGGSRYGTRSTVRTIRTSAFERSVGPRLDSDYPPVVHPAVFVQPETGRKVLNISPFGALHIVGHDDEAGHALLRQLVDHLVGCPAYHHRWQPSEMLLWDNWRMVHCVSGAPADEVRIMQRTTIAGDYGLGRRLIQPIAA